MRRALSVVILVAAWTNVAAAGGYVGLGVGTNTFTESDPPYGERFTTTGRSAKILGGIRFGRFAVEGAIGGFPLQLDDRAADGASIDAYYASLAGKFSLPLGSGFEVFGKAGLHHSWLGGYQAGGSQSNFEASGNGFLLAVGAEYRINTGIGSGSIFIDYQLTKATLENEYLMDVDATTRIWTLGFTIGF